MNDKTDRRNALGILKLAAQGEEDIRKGKASPQDEVFARIKKGLTQK
nr:hypothetical protein [Candidatus Krumholzibacteria bacterium]